MAYKTVTSLDADNTITIGGFNKKTRTDNPTSAEGYYLGCRSVTSNKYGESYLHFFQTSKGNLGVWGKTDLDKKLKLVPVGTMTLITYLGTKPTKYGDMHLYKVQADSANVIEVAELAAESSADNEQRGSDSSDYTDDGDSYEDTEETEDDSDNEPAIAVKGQTQEERKAKIDALLKKGKKAV